MSSSPAISVSGLSKSYRIARNHEAHITATEAALARLRHPLRRPEHDVFKALDGVHFEIPWGEAVGVIGRNGAGKSTLLKILTRITAPTTGRIELGGRVGSLLEIGTGFHPELTGRENVYLNGTLLGMRRREIDKRFEEIVEFSGVERFLETPVKRYSSGMYIRLAFAVAAHLETEILAVDEVLAVGDAEFQAKCLAKMRQVAQDGRTVLLVSHQVQTVMSLCSSAIYLENGRMLEHGPVSAAMEHYKQSFALSSQAAVDPDSRPGTGEVRLVDAHMEEDILESTDEKVVRFKTSTNEPGLGLFFVSAHVKNEDGVIVMQCDSRLNGFWMDSRNHVEGSLRIGSPWLKPGRYTVDLFLCKSGVLDEWDGACTFQVMPTLPYPKATTDDGTAEGVVFGDFTYASH